MHPQPPAHLTWYARHNPASTANLAAAQAQAIQRTLTALSNNLPLLTKDEAYRVRRSLDGALTFLRYAEKSCNTLARVLSEAPWPSVNASGRGAAGSSPPI
jgi:hypothetical protein